jgi:hypothetical protein
MSLRESQQVFVSFANWEEVLRRIIVSYSSSNGAPAHEFLFKVRVSYKNSEKERERRETVKKRVFEVFIL